MGKLATLVKEAESNTPTLDAGAAFAEGGTFPAISSAVGSMTGAWSGRPTDTSSSLLSGLKDKWEEHKEAPRESTYQGALGRLGQAAASPTSGKEDIGKMEAMGVPSSQSESVRNALKWTAIVGGSALAAGAAIRLLRYSREGTRTRRPAGGDYGGIPGRERVLRIPHSKRSSDDSALQKDAIAWPAVLAGAGVGGAALLPSIGESVTGLAEKGLKGGKELASQAFSPTGSGLDAPWMLPAAVVAGIGGLGLGYAGVGKLLDNMRKRRSKRRIAEAKTEFERALRGQHRESERAGTAGVKYSSMGAAVDVLAKSHVSGELAAQLGSMEKSAYELLDEKANDPTQPAFGEGVKGYGRKGLGVYLAMLTALGGAGLLGGYMLARKSDPERIRAKNLKRMVARRNMARPPLTVTEAA